MVVILLGPPGVGKGTQAVRLTEAADFVHVSTGDLLRAARREGTELGRKAQGFMDRGELVPDDLILDLVRERLEAIEADTGILFDGFPRTTPQADGLEEVLDDVDRRVDLVVVFEAPEEILVKRLSGRRSCPGCGAVYNVHFSPPESEGTCDRCGEELMHRKDDDPDTVRRRLGVYREETEPLVRWYGEHQARTVHIGADRDVDEVQADLRRAVES
jgi:adenylate kinase